jgi:hypothetical protein
MRWECFMLDMWSELRDKRASEEVVIRFHIQSCASQSFLTTLQLKSYCLLTNTCPSQGPVAHACNPSYSGGKDQEDCSLRMAWAKSESLSIKYPT